MIYNIIYKSYRCQGEEISELIHKTQINMKLMSIWIVLLILAQFNLTDF